ARNGSRSARPQRARSGARARQGRLERARIRRRIRRGAGARAPRAARAGDGMRAHARADAVAPAGSRGAAMTWAELHDVLRDRGLVRAGDTAGAVAVTGIAHDSRAVTRGQVFVALKGQHADGTAFARQAIDRGAAAIVSEQKPPGVVQALWTIVKAARLALSQLAAASFGNPSREMRVLGITGTNGKTTT